MKTKNRLAGLLPSALVAITLIFGIFQANAASDSWNADAADNWTTTTRWLLNNGTVPGSTTTDNSDIATFSFTLTAGRAVTVDTTRYIGGISFGNTSAYGYTLQTGALNLNNGGVIQTLSGDGAHTETISSAIKIDGGSGSTATFTAGATTATANNVTVSGGVTGTATTTSGLTTLTLNGSRVGSGTTAPAMDSLTGIIGDGSGGGKLAIIKAGAGRWCLGGSSANTFSGGLTINAGELILAGKSTAGGAATGNIYLGDTAATGASATLTLLNSSSSMGTPANALTVQSGSSGTKTIKNNGNSATPQYGGAITMNDNLTVYGGVSGSLTFSTAATINLNANTLTLNGGTLTCNGVISGSGNVTQAAAGTSTLGAANTFSGTALVTQNTGTLALNNVNALQNATLDTGASGSQSVTFIVSGNNTYNIGALQGANSLSIGANTISVGNKNGTTTFTGAIGVTTAAGGLTKVNASSTQILSGANIYTGSTAINAGTLKLTGGSLADTAISFGGTATLGVQPGSATSIDIGNTTTTGAGATLSIGANNTFDMTDTAISTCNLKQGATFGSTALTIATGATFKFDLSNTTCDQLVVTKTASASGTINVTLSAASAATSLQTGTPYTLISAASGSTLNSATWSLTSSTLTVNGSLYSLSLSASATAVTVTATPTYTVTYNGNTADSGNVPVDGSSPYVSGASVTVLGNIGSPSLTKSGYTFNGWNTASDGSGTSYSAGNNFTIAANTILYAKWLGTASITTSQSTFSNSVSTTYGTASSSTRVVVTGSGISGSITATAPSAGAALEVSSDNSTFGTTATLPSTGGTLYVRLKNNASAGNYNSQNVSLSGSPATTITVATTSAGNTVSQKALTIASATALGKLYDGGNTATVTGTLQSTIAFGSGTSSDGKPYDTLTVTCTGSTFANAGPGTGISVTAGTFGVTGAAAANYTVTQPTLSLSADILALGVWTNTVATATWGTAANWSNSIVATNTGFTADFNQVNITSDPTTVNLAAPQTIGNLIFGDTDTSSAAGWVLANSSTPANVLTLAGTTPTVTVNALGTGKSVTISAAIAGTSGLTKSGSGKLILNNTNTYSGGTTLTAGTLTVASTNALGSAGNALQLNGGSLEIALNQTDSGNLTAQGYATTVGGNVEIIANKATSSSGIVHTLGTFSIGANTLTVTRGANVILTIVPGVAFTGTTFTGAPTFSLGSGANITSLALGAVNNGANTATITGVGNFTQTGVWGNGSGGITLDSGFTGTATLSGANTYTGTTLVSGGTLALNNVNAVQNSTLDTGSSGSQSVSFTVGGNNIYNIGALQGSIGLAVGGNTISVGSKNADTTFGAVISGASGNLVKVGSGKLTLTGNNTYSGATVINAGTLALNGNALITNTANIVVASNAIFDVSGLSSSFTLASALSSQTLSNSAPGAILNGTNNCSTGTISLVYDGVNPSFIMTNGGMLLSSSTTVKINNTSSALGAGSYLIISNNTSGTAGLVSGTAPSFVTVTGGNLVTGCTASVQISSAGLNLVVSKSDQTIGYTNGMTLTKTYGNAAFADGATNSSGLTLAYSSDNTGVATVDAVNGTVTILAAGNCHIIATNSGSAGYNPSSASQSLTIIQASTFVGASSTKNPSGYKDSIAFLAMLPADATGNVVFFSTNGAFSTNTVTGASTSSLSITNLPRGTNLVTVAYSGDGNYFGSTNTLNQIVTNHPPVATDATYYRAKGLSLKIAITNLLTYVTDVDGDTNTIQSVGAGLTNATIMTDSTYVYYLPATGGGKDDNDVVSYTVSDGFGGSATANILIDVYSAAGPAQMSIPTNGVVNITFHGIPNYTYIVQTTTNLSVPWWTLSTNTASTNGSWLFTDPNATNAQQYYRSSQP